VTRVLLDATAVPADHRGVGRYLDGLVGALRDRVMVVCQQRDAELMSSLGAAEVVPVSQTRVARFAWEQTGLPRLAQRLRAEVLHCPHYTMPVRAGRPVVVTVHDLTFFTEPAVHTAGRRRLFTQATRFAVGHAAAVVVPSRSTGDELRRIVGDPRAVVVAHHGVDTALFHPPTAEEKRCAAADLDVGDYVAFLGTIEPRKNLPALVRAWVGACADRTDPPALVLAGGAGWDAAELDDAVAAVPPGLTVRRPGYLPLERLRGYLGGAAVVAYPALAEGFGLPVLEAMACGAAVLTTPRTSLPEVGGDAVAYAEPDVPSLTDALTGLLDHPGRRAELGAAGIARAAGFTWEACAEAHLRAYRTAARA
jgi:glycosyltransferase involved in cell wall biosynthesis